MKTVRGFFVIVLVLFAAFCFFAAEASGEPSAFVVGIISLAIALHTATSWESKLKFIASSARLIRPKLQQFKHALKQLKNALKGEFPKEQ